MNILANSIDVVVEAKAKQIFFYGLIARRGTIPAGFLYLFLYLIADPSLSGLRVTASSICR